MHIKVTIKLPVLYHYTVGSIGIWTVTDFPMLPLFKTAVDLKSNHTGMTEVFTFQGV